MMSLLLLSLVGLVGGDRAVVNEGFRRPLAPASSVPLTVPGGERREAREGLANMVHPPLPPRTRLLAQGSEALPVARVGTAIPAPSGCKGFVVMSGVRLSGPLWMKTQPMEGYHGNSQVCCGLCQHHDSCTSWSTNTETNRCWLHVSAPDTPTSLPFETALAKRSVMVVGVHPNAIPGDQDSTVSLWSPPASTTTATVVNPDLVRAFEALPPIPHRLHVIFPSKGIVDSQAAMARHGVRRLIDLNPTWSWKVYDDAEMDTVIVDELSAPEPLLTPHDVDTILKSNVIERSDIARLLLMWREGGFYQDADRVYNVPMSQALPQNIRMVIPTMGSPPKGLNFMQDMMCTAPGNPIVRRAIGLANEIRRDIPRVNGSASVSATLKMGATWGNAITLELFGVSRFEEAEHWESALAALSHVPTIIVSVERWCDGFWVRPYKRCQDVSRGGLYSEFKVQGWSGVINAMWRAKCDVLRDRQRLAVGREVALRRVKAGLIEFDCDNNNHRKIKLPPELKAAMRRKYGPNWREQFGKHFGDNWE